MTHLQIDNLNAGISYAEGKIVWEPNKGYTSELIKRLYTHGYTCSISGCMHYLRDDKGSLVTSAYSWPGLLQSAAIVLR